MLASIQGSMFYVWYLYFLGFLLKLKIKTEKQNHNLILQWNFYG
jgi:hypothetical protein